MVKKYNVKPFASVAVLYARSTVRVPFWLKRSCGSCTTLPGAYQMHGLLDVVAADANAGRASIMKAIVAVRKILK